MKYLLILQLIFLGYCKEIFAQSIKDTIITGVISCDSVQIEGISVYNCTNKMMAVSDKTGCFSIQAKVGDILNFSGIDYKLLRKYVYKFEYNSGQIEVNMTLKAIELDEVIVNKFASITAENLGIIPKGQKKLSPQERRLYTNSGGFQGFYSWLSGERDILKINVEIEKKEMYLKKLDYLFGNKYYIRTLKIPQELIKGFQYYCIEDPDFVQSLDAKNKTVSMFLMSNLALDYNKKRNDFGLVN
jgi:hypothetical protein